MIRLSYRDLFSLFVSTFRRCLGLGLRSLAWRRQPRGAFAARSIYVGRNTMADPDSIRPVSDSSLELACAAYGRGRHGVIAANPAYPRTSFTERTLKVTQRRTGVCRAQERSDSTGRDRPSSLVSTALFAVLVCLVGGGSKHLPVLESAGWLECRRAQADQVRARTVNPVCSKPQRQVHQPERCLVIVQMRQTYLGEGAPTLSKQGRRTD